MFRNLTFPVAAAAMLATAAYADPVPVSEILVEAELTAIENAEAGRYWANIEADLTNAIAARLADQTDEDGVRVRVRVEALSLADSFELMTSGGEAYLEGHVIVAGEQVSEGYTLRISVPEARIYLPEGAGEGAEGVVLVPVGGDADAHYRAIIEAFAGHVADKLG